MTVSLDELPDTFTTATACGRGMHHRDLYRLRDSGAVVELSRGVFRKADSEQASLPDLLAVAYRVPGAITCCLSAAAVHELTDEIPLTTQIAVPRHQRPPRIDHPPTQVFRFAEATFELGVGTVEAAPGEYVRVYNPARTVVDLMRLRHRHGEPVALTALRRYVRRADARPGLVLDIARALDVFGPVRNALDALIAE
ncbi:type IV toxin-antitoxin system AbiEi family antitoxin domain-containing protein [Saccharothrix coeruleofusca]|nr:type IV toxin-antitoxin system AbiEi family antitoxin domain-containing protein [Saccharothrix coeruleofusca]MBP2340939.1 putative transcriptional regulator of viral defense system [Saccharothrix coeruleofusca]